MYLPPLLMPERYSGAALYEAAERRPAVAWLSALPVMSNIFPGANPPSAIPTTVGVTNLRNKIFNRDAKKSHIVKHPKQIMHTCAGKYISLLLHVSVFTQAGIYKVSDSEEST